MEENKEELKSTPIICPICGHKHTDKPIRADEESLKEYMRALLGQRPYRKVFKVAGGLIELTFEALNGEDVLRLEHMVKKDKIMMDDLADSRLLATLYSVTTDDGGIKNILYKADKEERVRLSSNWEEGIKHLSECLDATCLNLCRQCNTIFIILTNALSNGLLDRDFYEGVGLL